MTMKTKIGPMNQKASLPVHDTSPQARNGIAGIKLPSSQAYLLVSRHSSTGATICTDCTAMATASLGEGAATGSGRLYMTIEVVNLVGKTRRRVKKSRRPV